MYLSFLSVFRMAIAARGQDIFHFRYDDFKLLHYEPHPPIAMEIAV